MTKNRKLDDKDLENISGGADVLQPDPPDLGSGGGGSEDRDAVSLDPPTGGSPGISKDEESGGIGGGNDPGSLNQG